MQVNTRLSGEDSVQLLLSSHYGWQAHVLLNWASPRGRNPDLVIMGEGGTIELWPGAAYFDHYPAKPLSLTRLVSHVRPVWLAERLSSPLLQRVRRRVPSGDGSGYMGEISEFLAAVSEERPPVSGPEDARRDLEIVLRGFEALRSQAWTTVEPYGPRTG
jgi:predicted dehydrogenase